MLCEFHLFKKTASKWHISFQGLPGHPPQGRALWLQAPAASGTHLHTALTGLQQLDVFPHVSL